MNDGVNWSLVVNITLVMLVSFAVLYGRFFRTATAYENKIGTKRNEWFGLGVLLIVGLTVRMIMAYSTQGFLNDMRLFKAWGEQVYEDGVSSVYYGSQFIDYPPGYLCVLGGIEGIIRFLGLGDIKDYAQGIVNLIYKMPACLCDLAAGYYIYKIARERLPKNISLLLVASYIFNPSILINSAAWGQVDGVYALAVVAMLYYITKKKLPIAYFICVLGVLVKPQMMFFGPILIWAIIEQVFLEDFNWKKFWINLFSGLTSILCGLLFMIPFGIGKVIGQYTETLASYPYATVNAYNLWGALGMNWKPQEDKFLGIPAMTWGTFFLIVSVLFTILICYQMRKDKSKYFFAGGCLMTMIFTLSVRMHERYLFPAMVLLLIAYCMKPIKQLFFAYAGISMVHFLNVGFVYMINPGNVGYTSEKQPEVVWMSILMVLMLIYVLYIAVRWYLVTKKENEELLDAQIQNDVLTKPEKKKYFAGITPSKILGKITKLDIYIIIGITCLYSAIAIYNLGELKGDTPNTEYMSRSYRSITFNLGEDIQISKVAYYLGEYANVTFRVETADSPAGPWTDKGLLTMEKKNSWGEQELSIDQPYMKLTTDKDIVSLFEMVMFDKNGNVVVPEGVATYAKYQNLFDESSTYEAKETPKTEFVSKWYEDPTTVYPSITLDLGDQPNVSKLAYYLGNYEKRTVNIESSNSLEGPWTSLGQITMESVFCWGENDISSNQRYLRISTSQNALSLFELVVLNSDGNMIQPLNGSEEAYKHLFDENDTYGERTARNGTYFDEIYHARTAYEYMQGRYSYENTHPPLGKCFIALGMLIFGVCPFGWRIMGVLFGIAMLPCIYLFIKRMFKETWIASCVTLLFAFDFMHFAQTRIATIDVFVTFFIILMYYFMYQYVSMSFYDTPLKKTFIPLGLSGICMGFGVASKWTGAYAGVGLAVIFFTSLYRRYKEYIYARDYGVGETNGIAHKDVVAKFKPYARKTILFCCVFFVVIPFIIYTLSYLPFNDESGDNLIVQMLHNQETMFSYHSDLESTHPYSCTWDKWPTIYKPIWYYSRHVSDTVSEGISAFGNPFVWWVGIPAAVYMVYLIWKERDRKAVFFLISYFAQYLPWTLISRTTYMYHYFPSVPFVCMMIGYSMYKLVNGNARRRKIAYFYVAVTVGLFFLFYPVLSGYPVEKEWVFDNLKWFDTWVLVT